MTTLINLVGEQFGGLLVLHRAPPHPSRATFWTCRCEGCGTLRQVDSQHLRRGLVRSCGGPTCRGRWPMPDPAAVLAEQHRPGSVGTVSALLRASLDDDHAALLDVARGLGDDDDLLGLVLHLTRLCSVALVRGEGSTHGAQQVVDTLAALDRSEAQ